MKALLIVPLLLLGACRRAEPVPPPPVQRLTLHFLDQDGHLRLAQAAPPGRWDYMDAGLWRPLDLRWSSQGRSGDAVVTRTAPTWVLLRDPEGGIHRIVMREEPERTSRSREGMKDEDREWLASVGLLWVLQWIRR